MTDKGGLPTRADIVEYLEKKAGHPQKPKELARAETLFQARRWAGAKQSYDRVKSFVAATDRDRVLIRIAAADIALGRNREGRDALRPHLTGPLADEANFHYVTATRGLKLRDEHIALSRAFVTIGRVDVLKQLVLFAAAGLFVSLLMLTYGVDLSPGFF